MCDLHVAISSCSILLCGGELNLMKMVNCFYCIVNSFRLKLFNWGKKKYSKCVDSKVCGLSWKANTLFQEKVAFSFIKCTFPMKQAPQTQCHEIV